MSAAIKKSPLLLGVLACMATIGDARPLANFNAQNAVRPEAVADKAAMALRASSAQASVNLTQMHVEE
ncbi:MAG: hypothetical protein JNM52_11670, partial [Betaproteobacteria bacterium]|nr:hypothetical protein [Betaproteobacteria bacterium]